MGGISSNWNIYSPSFFVNFLFLVCSASELRFYNANYAELLGIKGSFTLQEQRHNFK